MLRRAIIGSMFLASSLHAQSDTVILTQLRIHRTLAGKVTISSTIVPWRTDTIRVGGPAVHDTVVWYPFTQVNRFSFTLIPWQNGTGKPQDVGFPTIHDTVTVVRVDTVKIGGGPSPILDSIQVIHTDTHTFVFSTGDLGYRVYLETGTQYLGYVVPVGSLWEAWQYVPSVNVPGGYPIVTPPRSIGKFFTQDLASTALYIKCCPVKP